MRYTILLAERFVWFRYPTASGSLWRVIIQVNEDVVFAAWAVQFLSGEQEQVALDFIN